MKIYFRFPTLILLAGFIAAPQAIAQQATPEEQKTQEAAFLRLQELGLTRGNGITGEDFFDQIVAGNVEAVKLFLAAGVSPDVQDMRDQWKRNALLIAAEYGQAEVVQALVEAGADVGVKDWVGRTPLVVAVMREQEEVVHVLLEAQQKN